LEHIGDLRIAETVPLSKPNDGSKMLGKRPKKLRDDLTILELLREERARASARCWPAQRGFAVENRLRGASGPVAGFSPPCLERRPHGDPIEPRPEARTEVEAGEVAINGDEHFLANIFGRLPIPENAVHEAEDPRVVELDEQPERILVAVDDTTHQGALIAQGAVGFVSVGLRRFDACPIDSSGS